MLMLVFMKFNNRRIGGCMVVDIVEHLANLMEICTKEDTLI